tara:strand:+ start:134 stop:448 length:315 start_codon:yes stop_codon:yes gene_type:complete
MKIKKDGKIINLTESDLKRIVKKSLVKEESNTMEWDISSERIEKDELHIEDLQKRLTILEKEVHGDLDGKKFGDRSLQEQIAWLNSGMDELGKTVSRILKHIKL